MQAVTGVVLPGAVRAGGSLPLLAHAARLPAAVAAQQHVAARYWRRSAAAGLRGGVGAGSCLLYAVWLWWCPGGRCGGGAGACSVVGRAGWGY